MMISRVNEKTRFDYSSQACSIIRSRRLQKFGSPVQRTCMSAERFILEDDTLASCVTVNLSFLTFRSFSSVPSFPLIERASLEPTLSLDGHVHPKYRRHAHPFDMRNFLLFSLLCVLRIIATRAAISLGTVGANTDPWGAVSSSFPSRSAAWLVSARTCCCTDFHFASTFLFPFLHVTLTFLISFPQAPTANCASSCATSKTAETFLGYFTTTYTSSSSLQARIFFVCDNYCGVAVNSASPMPRTGGGWGAGAPPTQVFMLQEGQNEIVVTLWNGQFPHDGNNPAGVIVAVVDTGTNAVLFETSISWTHSMTAPPAVSWLQDASWVVPGA